MSSTTMFFRLLVGDEKDHGLIEAINATRMGNSAPTIYAVVSDSFRQIPDAPFAYWVSEAFLRNFAVSSPIETGDRAIRVGLQTGDDFRFVRTSWEVNTQQVLDGHSGPWKEIGMFQSWCRAKTADTKHWVPFAKGGAYSPYYSDIHLVVNWQRDGEEIRGFVDPVSGRSFSRPQNADYYFRPGLTWSDRTTRLFSSRIWPSGGIFSVKGSAGFSADASFLPVMLALQNSLVFNVFLSIMVGAADAAARSYQVGTIGRVPIPELRDDQRHALGALALACVEIKRDWDTANETSHVFRLPVPLQAPGETLAARGAAWETQIAAGEAKIVSYQREIDDRAFSLYGIVDADRRAMEATLVGASTTLDGDAEITDTVPSDPDDELETEAGGDPTRYVLDLLSYAVGCAFGRWDLRLATGERTSPPLPDPFAPLPVCSPGMLVGDDGLPVITPPPGYPLAVALDGLLVDDPGDEWDIVRRVQAVLELLWPDDAEAIAAEACTLLGVKELRDLFRTGTRFFDDHIKRYSKSRRKAPIYWLLQSPRKQYGIWLYYHRLDADLIAKAAARAQAKLDLEEQRLGDLRAAAEAAGDTGAAARRAAKEVEKQESVIADIREFRDRLRRVALLRLTPDHDDGVILNIAPLREVVPWPAAKAAWRELVAGKYPWSSIGKQLADLQANGTAIE